MSYRDESCCVCGDEFPLDDVACTPCQVEEEKERDERHEAELAPLRDRIEVLERQRGWLGLRATHGGTCPGPVGLPCSCGLAAIIQEIEKEKETK